jgi:hypothetical protein
MSKRIIVNSFQSVIGNEDVMIKIQFLVVAILAVASIIGFTLLSVTFLIQLLGIFYTAAVNAATVTAIIIVASVWIHTKFEAVS